MNHPVAETNGLKLEGYAAATYRLEGKASLSVLTQGWTDEEKRNLIDGHPAGGDQGLG